MAVQDGYSRYACDVQSCNSSTFALPETDEADSYVMRRRIDASGVERKMLLCPEHAAIYADIVKACDGYYTEFEQTGKARIIAKADLEAANAAVAALQTKLDEAEKARKWWGDKYRQLEEEFNAYKAAHPDKSAGSDA